MCCFQSSCSSCCCNRFPVVSCRSSSVGPMGPQGPMGPMGPMGPQGPQGTSATNNFASFTATPATATLSTGSAIPLTVDYNNDPTDISFTGGTTVTLQSGTYLISFGSNATPNEAETVSLSLALNGTTVSKTTSTGTAPSASNTVPLNSEFILNVPTTSTISLVNSGEYATSYANTNLVISKIA